MLLSLVLGLLAPSASAGELQFVHSVQVSDADGQAVSGPHSVSVSLLDAGQQEVWTQTFVNVPLAAGHASLTLNDAADGTTLESALFGDSPAASIRTVVAGLPTMVEPLQLGTVPVAARSVGAQVLSDVAGDSCSATGALAFDDQAKLLVVCTDGAWVLVQ